MNDESVLEQPAYYHGAVRLRVPASLWLFVCRYEMTPLKAQVMIEQPDPVFDRCSKEWLARLRFYDGADGLSRSLTKSVVLN